MNLLLMFLIASIVGAFLVARVIIWSTQRASDSAITRYFRAGEFILETRQPPPQWYKGPSWKRLIPMARLEVSQREIMDRLDDLIRFYEQCSFFEDEWTREQLLSQLADVRASWQRSLLV